MAKLIKVNHIKGSTSISNYDVNKVRSMSDSEAEERAKNDPDAPPITSFLNKKIKRVKSK